MKNIIKVMLLSGVLLALVSQLAIADNIENHEFLYGYLAGHYIVIGKELDSEKTYYGKVVFSYEDERLIVMRDIQGQIVKGEGKIEHILGLDEANVLRVRFVQAGKKYEITYLWRSDLDNYARLSGYLYEPGKKTDKPGMEVLFIDHTKK
ncbi:MAG: hypothetical protein ABIJ37_04675 [Pseudomonadota bacterium]